MQATGHRLADSERLAAFLSDIGPTLCLDLQFTLVCEPVSGCWLRAKGGWVPIFDNEENCLLSPVPGPRPNISCSRKGSLPLDSDRTFFAADEFPQLAVLAEQWKELREEALLLWKTRSDLFVEREGHCGLVVCAFMLWGQVLNRNLGIAPAAAAAQALRGTNIGQLKTFAYSILKPNCHILLHEEHHGTTGIRAHLGLHIPFDCCLRVGPYACNWSEGGWTIFDGSRNHAVLNAGPEHCIVLLVDFESPPVDPLCWPNCVQHVYSEMRSSADQPQPPPTV